MFYKRVIWGAVILAVLVGVFFLREVSTYFFDAVFAALIALGAMEICDLFAKKDKPTFKIAVALFPVLLTVLVIICVSQGVVLWQYFLLVIAVAALLFVGFATLPFMFKRQAYKAYRPYSTQVSFSNYVWEASKNSTMAMVYPTLLLSFLFVINHFNDFNIIAEKVLVTAPNVALFGLIMVLVVSMVADSFALFFGRLITSPKISMEKLGRGKTWSGLAGGIAGGAVGMMIVYGVLYLCFPEFKLMFQEYDLTYYLAIVAGLCGGIFTMMGDMFSSFIKRKAGVKDFSSLIPGHGGMMDRLNGIALNAVFVFIFLLVVFA